MKKGMSMVLALLLAFSAVFCPVFAQDADAEYYGDANGDGKVNSTDARLILRHAAKLDQLSDAALARVDMNGDQKVNSSDARFVLRTAARLEDVFRVGEEIHHHEYEVIRENVTCEKGGEREMKCRICGKVNIETVQPGHHYTTLTCTQPKQCTVCGYIGQYAPGHTTQFGYCRRCGELRTELLQQFGNICYYFSCSVDYYNAAVDAVNADSYGEFKSNLQLSRDFVATAAEECGSCQEFAELKVLLNQLGKTIESMYACNLYTEDGWNRAVDFSETAVSQIDQINQYADSHFGFVVDLI